MKRKYTRNAADGTVESGESNLFTITYACPAVVLALSPLAIDYVVEDLPNSEYGVIAAQQLHSAC